MTEATKHEPQSIVDLERRRRNRRAATLLRKWLEEHEEPSPGDSDEALSAEDLIPPPIRLRDVDIPGN